MQILGVEEIDKNFGEYLHHTDSFISKIIYEKELNVTFSMEVKIEFERLLTEKMEQQHIVEIPGDAALVNAIH